jgi:hypothetical protein
MDATRTSTRTIPGIGDHPRSAMAVADPIMEREASPERVPPVVERRSERTSAVQAVVDPDPARNDQMVQGMMPDLAMAYLAANGALGREPASAVRSGDDAIERTRAKQAGQTVGVDIQVKLGSGEDRAALLSALVTPRDGRSLSQVRIATVDEDGQRSWSLVADPRSDEGQAAMLRALNSGGSVEVLSRAKPQDSIRDALLLGNGNDISVNGIAFSPRQARMDLVDAARALHADTAHPEHAPDARRVQQMASERLHEVAMAYREAASTYALPAMTPEMAGFLDADRLAFGVRQPAGWSRDEAQVTAALAGAEGGAMSADRLQDQRVSAWLGGFDRPATATIRIEPPADASPMVDTILRIHADPVVDHDRVSTELMPPRTGMLRPAEMVFLAGVVADANQMGFGDPAGPFPQPSSIAEARRVLEAGTPGAATPDAEGALHLTLSGDPRAADADRETLLASAIALRQSGREVTAAMFTPVDGALQAHLQTRPIPTSRQMDADELS